MLIQRAIRRALAKYRVAKMKRIRRMNSYIQAERERDLMRAEDLGKIEEICIAFSSSGAE